MNEPASPPSVLDTRREQMFPVLAPAEIEKLRRFGDVHRYKSGDLVVRAGKPTEGLMLVLSGHIRMAPHEKQNAPIVTHGPGEFQGELAQLSGRPSLVDGTADGDVEVVLIAPQRLRDLMVEEAELGERIMRALILRRVGLLEQKRRRSDHRRSRRRSRRAAAGRLPASATVIRTGASIRTRTRARARCSSDFMSSRPIFRSFCVRTAAAAQSEREPAGALHRLVRRVDRAASVYDVAIVGAGPAGLAAAVYAASEGLSVDRARLPRLRRSGRRLGAHRELSGFPTGITGMALMARAYNQAQKFGAEMAIPEEVVSLDASVPADGRFSLRLTGGDMVTARSRRHRERRGISPPRRGQHLATTKARMCIIGPRRSRRGCARARKSRWSAPAIPPARPLSISRARRRRSG